MSNRVYRLLASIGFTYLVMALIQLFTGAVHVIVAITIALLCGFVVTLTPWGGKQDR